MHNAMSELVHGHNTSGRPDSSTADGPLDLPTAFLVVLSSAATPHLPLHPPLPAEASTPFDADRPLAELVLVGGILAIMNFMSVTGNLLVCLAIYTDRGLRKLGNLFLVSLAIADLFVASLVMVFAIINDLLGYWMFGPQFCDVWVAFDIMCCTASILNLCAISLDRYLHIRDPMRYTRWMTKRVVLGSIGAVWLVSALVSFLPISQGLHKPENPVVTDPPTCAMDLSPTYAVVSSTISFFVPCAVMIALYSQLYMYARMHVRNIRAMSKPLHLNYEEDEESSPALGGAVVAKLNPTNGSQHHSSVGSGTTPLAPPTLAPPGPPSTSASATHSSQVSDHKAAVTLGIIVGTFLICWVPFFCVNITAAFCKTCISDLCFKILTWLGYANSTLNPIIYSIFNHDFRRAFRRILTGYSRTVCCYCCCLTGRRDNDPYGTPGTVSSCLPSSRRHRQGQLAAAASAEERRRRHGQSNGKCLQDYRDGLSSSGAEKDSTM